MPAYKARVALESHNRNSGALIINVLHAEVDTLSSPPNWNSVAGDIVSWFGTEYRNVLSTLDTFDQVVVTDETYPGSTLGQGVSAVALNGTRSVPLLDLDPAMCAVVSWKTAVAKRYARGHTFLPPCYSSSYITPPAVFDSTKSYWTAANTWAAKVVSGFTAGSTSYVPIVFSRTQVAKGSTSFSFAITAQTIPLKQHFLRSRTSAP